MEDRLINSFESAHTTRLLAKTRRQLKVCKALHEIVAVSSTERIETLQPSRCVPYRLQLQLVCRTYSGGGAAEELDGGSAADQLIDVSLRSVPRQPLQRLHLRCISIRSD